MDKIKGGSGEKNKLDERMELVLVYVTKVQRVSGGLTERLFAVTLIHFSILEICFFFFSLILPLRSCRYWIYGMKTTYR